MKYIAHLLFIPVPVAICITAIFVCVAGTIESMDWLNQYAKEWRTSLAAAASITVIAFWIIAFFGLGAVAAIISDYGDRLLQEQRWHDDLN